MNRTVLSRMLAGVLLAVVTAGAEAAGTNSAAKAQTVCPVMGGSINRSVYADYAGKRVYFCCGGCPAEFKKDPAKYVRKLESAGVALEPAPAK